MKWGAGDRWMLTLEIPQGHHEYKVGLLSAACCLRLAVCCLLSAVECKVRHCRAGCWPRGTAIVLPGPRARAGPAVCAAGVYVLPGTRTKASAKSTCMLSAPPCSRRLRLSRGTTPDLC